MSYDDGKIQDERLVGIFNKYGIKGTFNINYGRMEQEQTPPRISHSRVAEPCDAGAHPGEPLRKLYRGCAGAAHQRSGGRCGAEGESPLRRRRLRKKGLLKMPSACALGIFSGKNIL